MAFRLGIGPAALAAAAAAGAIGCGGDSKHASTTAPQQSSKQPATGATGGGAQPTRPASRSRGVALRVPSGFTEAHTVGSAQSWPLPLKVVASFPIRQRAANAACPRAILDAMPPDGVYMLVAEYTKPPPPGFPAGTPIRPRGDLAHLDLRPAEVECWDAGLSGAARFRDHGRDFYVQVLLGPKVTASQRQRALQALASLTVSPQT